MFPNNEPTCKYRIYLCLAPNLIVVHYEASKDDGCMKTQNLKLQLMVTRKIPPQNLARCRLGHSGDCLSARSATRFGSCRWRTLAPKFLIIHPPRPWYPMKLPIRWSLAHFFGRRQSANRLRRPGECINTSHTPDPNALRKHAVSGTSKTHPQYFNNQLRDNQLDLERTKHGEKGIK